MRGGREAPDGGPQGLNSASPILTRCRAYLALPPEEVFNHRHSSKFKWDAKAVVYVCKEPFNNEFELDKECHRIRFRVCHQSLPEYLGQLGYWQSNRSEPPREALSHTPPQWPPHIVTIPCSCVGR
jgi:hypothetical protein